MANTNPKQVTPPKWLVYGGVEFPASEASEYIQHDFKFGDAEGRLSVEGEVLEMQTTRGNAIFAACIPTEFSYQVDWDNHGAGEQTPDRVLEWTLEWHDTEAKARAAVATGIENAGWVPDDDGGDYGIHGEVA